jgi:CRISPR/Cas system-associated exonuclease Cas4 (RecB family)
MSIIRTEPLANLRQGLHVSVSQIKSWLMCPRKYAHSYVWGTAPAHRPVALAFGTAVHRALEMFYERLRDAGSKPPVDEVQTAFVDRWAVEVRDALPLLFDEGQSADQAKDLGVAMLGAFYQQGFVPDQVLAVEQPFGIELPDPETGGVMDIPLVGAIDLVARHQGRVWLIEHKTAARRFTPDRITWDFQPTSYLLAARSLGLDNPAAAFQILLKTKKPSCETIPLTRDQASEIEMLDTFKHALKGIEAGAFPRNRGWGCADCPFKHRCGG